MGIITSQEFIKEAYSVSTKIIKVDPFSIWIGQLQRPNSALKLREGLIAKHNVMSR